MGNKIFVGNLAFATTQTELEELFREFGTCESASIVTDRVSGRSRGFGFVEMSTPEEAARAIEGLNGRTVGGRQINVSEAKERPAGDRRPGGGGGGGGGRRRF